MSNEDKITDIAIKLHNAGVNITNANLLREWTALYGTKNLPKSNTMRGLTALGVAHNAISNLGSATTGRPVTPPPIGSGLKGAGFFKDIWNKAKDAITNNPVDTLKSVYNIGKKGVDMASKLKGMDIKNNPVGTFKALAGLGGCLPKKHRQTLHDNMKGEWDAFHGAGFFDKLKDGLGTFAKGLVAPFRAAAQINPIFGFGVDKIANAVGVPKIGVLGAGLALPDDMTYEQVLNNLPEPMRANWAGMHAHHAHERLFTPRDVERYKADWHMHNINQHPEQYDDDGNWNGGSIWDGKGSVISGIFHTMLAPFQYMGHKALEVGAKLMNGLGQVRNALTPSLAPPAMPPKLVGGLLGHAIIHGATKDKKLKALATAHLLKIAQQHGGGFWGNLVSKAFEGGKSLFNLGKKASNVIVPAVKTGLDLYGKHKDNIHKGLAMIANILPKAKPQTPKGREALSQPVPVAVPVEPEVVQLPTTVPLIVVKPNRAKLLKQALDDEATHLKQAMTESKGGKLSTRIRVRK
jgi:hypothetical protein